MVQKLHIYNFRESILQSTKSEFLGIELGQLYSKGKVNTFWCEYEKIQIC